VAHRILFGGISAHEINQRVPRVVQLHDSYMNDAIGGRSDNGNALSARILLRDTDFARGIVAAGCLPLNLPHVSRPPTGMREFDALAEFMSVNGAFEMQMIQKRLRHHLIGLNCLLLSPIRVVHPG